MTPEKLKARQLVKAKAFEAEMKRKTEFLKPIVIGCCWLQEEASNDPAYSVLKNFQVCVMLEVPEKAILILLICLVIPTCNVCLLYC